MTDHADRIRALHVEAELTYRRVLRRFPPSRKGLGGMHVATANAKAEGLAEAVAVLEDLDVVDVRARVRAALDRTEADGLAGAAGARAELEAARSRFDVV